MAVLNRRRLNDWPAFSISTFVTIKASQRRDQPLSSMSNCSRFETRTFGDFDAGEQWRTTTQTFLRAKTLTQRDTQIQRLSGRDSESKILEYNFKN
jgi:hypothetical protein